MKKRRSLISLLETCLQDDSIRLTSKRAGATAQFIADDVITHNWILQECDWILQVWCKLENESKREIDELLAFPFLFYLNWMYKWIYMSFVMKTSPRRFASLITSCWCNTTVVFTITRLSFSVSLDRFKSYRIGMRSFMY